ncbi:MAG: ATP-binding protein [Candidatus Falkowbacteria bacterium]|nr:ATP-binding protein [Candidatus Parcubacteria bacterium]
MELKNRKIIAKIAKYLNDDEIIVLHGARQVGKTSIINYLISKILGDKNDNKNLIYFDLEDFNLVELLNSGVEKTVEHLKGLDCDFNKKIYLFIDEIQYLENPSSFLKLFHDRYKGKIKLIATGSSSFEIKKKFKNSLAGRTVNFEIFNLDFEEFLWFKEEEINLSEAKSDILQKKLKNLYNEFALMGGYPAIVLEKSREKKEFKLKQIINTYIKKDIRDFADIRNINKFNDLLRLLADQSGSLLNILELSNSLNLAQQTIEDYLFILENTYIIRRIYPFHKNVRSELTKMPKVFLEDTGIANILANKTFAKTLSGSLFENSVFANLRRNTEMENIYFWRTNKGQEVDFIIENKKLMPIEVKLRYSGKTMKNLLNFSQKYNIQDLFCVTLNKKKDAKYKNIKQLYPWEVLV